MAGGLGEDIGGIIPHIGGRGFVRDIGHVRILLCRAVPRQHRRTPRGDDLWPDLPRAARARETSKRVGRYLRRHVTEDRALVAHSARNTFRDMMREAGVPCDVAMALRGWQRTESSNAYGDGPSIKVMALWVRRLRRPVDLAPLVEAPAPRRRRRGR